MTEAEQASDEPAQQAAGKRAAAEQAAGWLPSCPGLGRDTPATGQQPGPVHSALEYFSGITFENALAIVQRERTA
ncbi:hypothetical protein [Streptomyces sp. NPDC058613]|uniref:hypothetical protein n=1 Tax=Streptomyces sp. NPDC058613 TaxID=3346556 RepID=UPI0036499DB2